MAELKNELSWSHSRAGQLESCARAYYFARYLSWGGWNRDAPIHSKLAYRLKHLSAIPLWKGNLVHTALEGYWGQRRNGLDPSTPAKLSAALAVQAKAEWKDSIAQAVLNAPRPKGVLTLIEHVHPEAAWGGPVTEADRDKVILEAQNMLAAHFSSRLHDELITHSIVDVERLEEIQIAGVKVYVKMDLVTEERPGPVKAAGKKALKPAAPGKFYVTDWKTGKSKAADRRQLLLYGLAVSQMRTVSPTRVVGQDVYLKEGPDRLERQGFADEAGVKAGRDQLEKTVKADMKKMESLLATVETNTPKPMNAFKRRSAVKDQECQRCSFQRLCYGKEKLD